MAISGLRPHKNVINGALAWRGRQYTLGTGLHTAQPPININSNLRDMGFIKKEIGCFIKKKFCEETRK